MGFLQTVNRLVVKWKHDEDSFVAAYSIYLGHFVKVINCHDWNLTYLPYSLYVERLFPSSFICVRMWVSTQASLRSKCVDYFNTSDNKFLRMAIKLGFVSDEERFHILKWTVLLYHFPFTCQYKMCHFNLFSGKLFHVINFSIQYLLIIWHFISFLLQHSFDSLHILLFLALIVGYLMP